MAASAPTSSSFSRAVFTAMRKMYPESLADKSFDNTGLLLEAPSNPQANLKNKVLLTIDLTKAVANEAIEKKASVVVAYHPIIFRGLKSLTLANSQQSSLLRLAATGISVYSPHTAIDAAAGGNADWLADIVASDWLAHERTVKDVDHGEDGGYALIPFPSSSASDQSCVKINTIPHARTVVIPNATVDGAGMGRVVRYEQPQRLLAILRRLATYFGEPEAFSVAVPQGLEAETINVSSVAVCAGSGGSLFSGLDDVDMLITGELSHHEALAAIESGKCVVCLSHSNSERGYLTAVMKQRLASAIEEEFNGEFTVDVSEEDQDPFQSFVRRPYP